MVSEIVTEASETVIAVLETAMEIMEASEMELTEVSDNKEVMEVLETTDRPEDLEIMVKPEDSVILNQDKIIITINNSHSQDTETTVDLDPMTMVVSDLVVVSTLAAADSDLVVLPVVEAALDLPVAEAAVASEVADNM